MFKAHLLTGLTSVNGIFSLTVKSVAGQTAMLKIDEDVMVQVKTKTTVKTGDVIKVKLVDGVVTFDSIVKATSSAGTKSGTQGCNDNKRSMAETF